MTSSKSKKAEQTATADVVAKQNQAKQELIGAGQAANKQITEAGQPTTTENQLQSRYTSKATQPAEELLTGAGPISQAVANRVSERVNNPGMDFDTNSANFESNIGTPVWRALKARGIAAPPGSQGGGLGTEQYMTQVAPALAEARAGQVNTDISRGQEYGQQALSQQNIYAQLESALATLLGNRKYSAGVAGAGAEQAGVESGVPQGVAATQTNQAEVNKRYDQQSAEKAALGNALAQLIGPTAITGLLGNTVNPFSSSTTGTTTDTATQRGMSSVANQGTSNSTLDKQLLARIAMLGGA